MVLVSHVGSEHLDGDRCDDGTPKPSAIRGVYVLRYDDQPAHLGEDINAIRVFGWNKRMSYDIPTVTHALHELPLECITEVGGLYFRTVTFKDAGIIIPQHVHDHDHVTFIGSGKFRGWKDGEWIGDRSAGQAFDIPAGSSHIFMSLEANSLLACVHTIDSALSVKRKGL